MTNQKEDSIPSTKVQVAAICGDLARHSSTIDNLLSDESPVSNLYIQGHIEAHLEKIEDSLLDIRLQYEITENYLNVNNQLSNEDLIHRLQTQKQAMKLLLGNIQKLEAKVKSLLPKTKKKTDVSKMSPLRDLSRKLKNDLCRTYYLLQ